MADKLLAPSAWTAFAKKRELDDDALLKALGKLDKLAEHAYDEIAEALEDIAAQLKKLIMALAKRKPDKGDKNAEKDAKEVKDKLYEMMDVAERALKTAQAAKAASAGDEEEDSPVLLTTKMIPLLRELRKGEARMNALICTAGKATAVLIMRRTIAAGRRKLLAEQVDAKGGAKYIPGECLYEKGALTFVVSVSAGGLAKRVKLALFEQTEMRVKVRIRGEDGAEEEDGEVDGEAGENEGDEAGGKPRGESDAPGPSDEKTDAETATPPAPSAAALAYTQRLLKVKPRLEQALRDQHPEATRLRALSGFASEKAAAGDFDAAGKSLDMVQKLLDAAAPGTKPQDTAVDPGAAFNARFGALIAKIKGAAPEIKQKAAQAGGLAKQHDYDAAQALLDEVEAALGGGRVDSGGGGESDAGSKAKVDLKAAAKSCLEIWRDAKEEADAGLSKLQSALKGSDDPALQRIAEYGLNGVSQGLQVGLRVALQEFALKSDPAAVEQAATKLRRSVAEFQRFLDTDPAVQLCDDNPFDIGVALRPTLGKALRRIEEQLDALQA